MDGIPKVFCPAIIHTKKVNKAKLRLYVYSLRANGFTLAVNPLEIGSADDTWARQITEGSFNLKIEGNYQEDFFHSFLNLSRILES